MHSNFFFFCRAGGNRNGGKLKKGVSMIKIAKDNNMPENTFRGMCYEKVKICLNWQHLYHCICVYVYIYVLLLYIFNNVSELIKSLIFKGIWSQLWLPKNGTSTQPQQNVNWWRRIGKIYFDMETSWNIFWNN